ncbi:PREDICTED: pollen-specific leucine-rich repeat extensin-like protein 3 [Camelina sativa]|uniref:Pollen-specific leucine-rich repeat extensin-like protein 3 n=1 Tax=Camelina sativa TaxID=90675 RepID=A0ABM1QEC8_CAMSA|nr:PREDICTED: pollen-specific leucine-rich repeat extensin-like protein 3 [Camelina sativa]
MPNRGGRKRKPAAPNVSQRVGASTANKRPHSLPNQYNFTPAVQSPPPLQTPEVQRQSSAAQIRNYPPPQQLFQNSYTHPPQPTVNPTPSQEVHYNPSHPPSQQLFHNSYTHPPQTTVNPTPSQEVHYNPSHPPPALVDPPPTLVDPPPSPAEVSQTRSHRGHIAGSECTASSAKQT